MMSTASSRSLKQSCSALTSVTSALEVIFNVMRSINSRFTYLLTYLLAVQLIHDISKQVEFKTYRQHRSIYDDDDDDSVAAVEARGNQIITNRSDCVVVAVAGFVKTFFSNDTPLAGNCRSPGAVFAMLQHQSSTQRYYCFGFHSNNRLGRVPQRCTLWKSA